jgi:hypothetical protein
VRSPDVTAFARAPNGGLIVVLSGIRLEFRDAIIAAAARQKLPAIYSFRRLFGLRAGEHLQEQLACW